MRGAPVCLPPTPFLFLARNFLHSPPFVPLSATGKTRSSANVPETSFFSIKFFESFDNQAKGSNSRGVTSWAPFACSWYSVSLQRVLFIFYFFIRPEQRFRPPPALSSPFLRFRFSFGEHSFCFSRSFLLRFSFLPQCLVRESPTDAI